jgi:dihydroxyacetone kinase-like protein
MNIDIETRRRLAKTVAAAVIDHADELTELDSAIGDGDHGHNMKRGMEAVLAEIDTIAEMPSGEALIAAGKQLVFKVGGASGPLYGTLLMGFGKSMPDQPTFDDLVLAFSGAIDAVKARGKAEVGQKTMLDVLVPVLESMRGGAGADLIVKAAADACAATVPMQAQRGRASFLGERSIGHVDPGARSSELMIEAAASVLGDLS